MEFIGTARINFDLVYFFRRKADRGSWEFGISCNKFAEPSSWWPSKRTAVKAYRLLTEDYTTNKREIKNGNNEPN
jgi:hypothetical protein